MFLGVDLIHWGFILAIVGVAFAALAVAVPVIFALRAIAGVVGIALLAVAGVLLFEFAGASLQSPLTVRSPLVFPAPRAAQLLETPSLKLEGDVLQVTVGAMSSGGPILAEDQSHGQANSGSIWYGTDPWMTPSGKKLKSLGCILPDSSPVHIFVENGYAYVNSTIYTVGFLPCVLVNHNVIDSDTLMNFPYWDWNSNREALEIVDESQRPVFQLVLKPPNHVIVQGVFPMPNEEVWVTQPDMPTAHQFPPFFDIHSSKGGDQMFHLKAKPLFKYPSFSHPGEFAK